MPEVLKIAWVGEESSAQHDKQNNLQEQIPFICKLPKVMGFGMGVSKGGIIPPPFNFVMQAPEFY